MNAEQAVTDLLATDGDRLLRFAFQLCHDRTFAEDLVQQASEDMLRHWRRRGVDAVNVPAYARRAVLNRYLSARRRSWMSEVVTSEPPDVSVQAVEDSIVDRHAMWQALEVLSPRQRAAVVLRYYEDLSDQQISDALGCRQSTVRSLLTRALSVLRTSDLDAAGAGGAVQ